MYKNSQLDELQGNKFATVFLIPKAEKKKQKNNGLKLKKLKRNTIYFKCNGF